MGDLKTHCKMTDDQLAIFNEKHEARVRSQAKITVTRPVSIDDL